MQVSRRNPLNLRHPRRVFAAVAVTILLLDQVAKAFVRARFLEGESIHLIPGLLNLTFVRNVGAAFGLFPGRQPVFILTSCFVLFVIAAYWRRARPREWPVVVALAMVSAGAFGNLIDRSVLGQVTDFFEFAFVEFPVFNVADMAILGGVALLALWLLFPNDASAEQLEAEMPEEAAEPADSVDPGQLTLPLPLEPSETPAADGGRG